MASTLQKYEESQQSSAGGKTNGGSPKSGTTDIDSSWRLVFNNQLDIIPMKGINKRNFIDLEMGSDGQNSTPDLNLKLSPPSVNTKDESFNESVHSSSPSECSCILMEPIPNLTPCKIETSDVPSLICMGCKCCQLYALVCEADPRCPNCHKSNFLLDVFRGSPVKKTRMN